MLESLGLTEVEDTKAGILSKGYSRRVTLAMALIGRPKILVLDDPCAGLDPASM